ncbi:conjugal transfer protein, partial [Butyricicoccus sp. 1XD8-22]
KTIGIVKKTSDAELKKSEEKKKIKNSKPKGMGARRLGMITFWLLFSFMFLVTTISIFGGDDSSSLNETEVERNKLFDNEGLEFAKDFVYEYFTWTTDKHSRDKRMANLDRYLMEGLDDLGGIIYNKDWASSIDKRDIVLKDVQKINDKQARYIFKVKFTLKSKTDEKNTNIDTEKLSFEEYLTEERKMKVINGYKTKVNEKFISVPVYYDEEVNRFAVFSLPS